MAEFKCAGGCGRTIIDPATTPSEPGWGYLPVSGRWRCPTCTQELRVAGSQPHKGEEWPLERVSKLADTCPLPTYDCACKGDWCRLLGRNLRS